MTDLARLGIVVDTTQVKDARQALEKLAAAGGRAEAGALKVAKASHALDDNAGDAARAMKALNQSLNDAGTNRAEAGMKRASAALKEVEKEGHAAAKGHDDLGKASAVAESHVDKMRSTLIDMAKELLSGESVGETFQNNILAIGETFLESGAGLGEWATALGLCNPVVLGVAAAVAVGASAFLLFKDDINKAADTDAFVKSLGLTDSQIRQLGDTSVTTGDMFNGLWDVIDRGLHVTEIFDKVKDAAVFAFRTALDWGTKAFVGLYAVSSAFSLTVQTVMQNIPAIIGDAFFSGANFAVKAIQDMVNAIIDNINLVGNIANKILKDMGFGEAFGHIQNVTLPLFENQFKGTIGNITGLMGTATKAFYDDGMRNIVGFEKDWTDASIAERNKRVTAKAEELRADGAAAAADTGGHCGCLSGTKPLGKGPPAATSQVLPREAPLDLIHYDLGKRRDDPELGPAPVLMGAVVDKFEDLRKVGAATASTIADAFGQAATSGGNFFDTLSKGLERLVAQWAAQDIERMFDKMFHVNSADTPDQSPLGNIVSGIFDSFHTSDTSIPHHANGTNFHRGGPAIINDGGGPEVVQLPRGSRVFTAMQSREMVQQAKPSPEVDLNAAAAVLAKVLAGHMAKVGNDAKGHADRNLNSYDRNLNRRMPALQRMGT